MMSCRSTLSPKASLDRSRPAGRRSCFFREGDTVHAVGGTCPHAGAPLIEGVAHAGRIVCPWHKATFCLRTGALLEPPAVDPLPQNPLAGYGRAGHRRSGAGGGGISPSGPAIHAA